MSLRAQVVHSGENYMAAQACSRHKVRVARQQRPLEGGPEGTPRWFEACRSQTRPRSGRGRPCVRDALCVLCALGWLVHGGATQWNDQGHGLAHASRVPMLTWRAPDAFNASVGRAPASCRGVDGSCVREGVCALSEIVQNGAWKFMSKSPQRSSTGRCVGRGCCASSRGNTRSGCDCAHRMHTDLCCAEARDSLIKVRRTARGAEVQQCSCEFARISTHTW